MLSKPQVYEFGEIMRGISCLPISWINHAIFIMSPIGYCKIGTSYVGFKTPYKYKSKSQTMVKFDVLQSMRVKGFGTAAATCSDVTYRMNPQRQFFHVKTIRKTIQHDGTVVGAET